MNAQKAVDELATHLLGEDFHIVDSVSGEQGYDIIVDEIKSRYEVFSDIKGACNAKDRIVNGNIHRPFCKVFQIKPFYEKEER